MTQQNNKDIRQNSKDIVKSEKAIAVSQDNINTSQIDIVHLFERIVQMETKLDMMSGESRSNDNWVRTFILIVVAIELINMVMNYILISLHP